MADKKTTLGQALLKGLKEAVDHHEGKIELKTTTLEKYREFWVRPPSNISSIGACVEQETLGGIHVIEFSAVQKLESKTELLNSEILKLKGQLVVEQIDHNKTKWALEQTNNGCPSEWAYSILRKERDEIKDKYDELVSYLQKVPTQPFEKELAKKANELLADAKKLRDGVGNYALDDGILAEKAIKEWDEKYDKA